MDKKNNLQQYKKGFNDGVMQFKEILAREICAELEKAKKYCKAGKPNAMNNAELVALASGFATVRILIAKIADELTEGGNGV